MLKVIEIEPGVGSDRLVDGKLLEVRTLRREKPVRNYHSAANGMDSHDVLSGWEIAEVAVLIVEVDPESELTRQREQITDLNRVVDDMSSEVNRLGDELDEMTKKFLGGEDISGELVKRLDAKTEEASEWRDKFDNVTSDMQRLRDSLGSKAIVDILGGSR